MNIHQVAMGCKPDPFKFKIEQIYHAGERTIVLANYGGLSFGGSKLMCLRGHYESFDTLDPHFLNADYPVFARFQPGDRGLSLAWSACSFDCRLEKEGFPL